MPYEGPPRYENLPLPGDDPRYPPMSRHDRGRATAELARELTLDGHMHRTATGSIRPNQPMPPGAENYGPMPGPWPAHPPTLAVVDGVRDVVDAWREKGITLQWQWGGFLADGVTVTPASPRYNGSYLLNRASEPPDNRAYTYEIHLWAYESQQIVPLGSGEQTPQRFMDDVDTFGSRLRARIAWNGASGGTFRDIDIGQGVRLAIRAPQPVVYLLYPQPANLQVQEGPLMLVGLGGGLVLNSQVGCSITPTDTTPSENSCTLTETILVPAGIADQQVRIPPGARTVTLWQTGAGATFTLEWRLLRGVAGSASMGELILGPARRIDHVTRPGAAGMITTGAADGVDRVLTLVWELDV